MTIEEMKKVRLGRHYWQEYVNVNGYAFAPSSKGIVKLSRLLDLTQTHIRQCINAYLDV